MVGRRWLISGVSRAPVKMETYKILGRSLIDRGPFVGVARFCPAGPRGCAG